MKKSNLIKGKIHQYECKKTGQVKMNALLKLSSLIDKVDDQGNVALTIIPQKQENLENPTHVKHYGNHYAVHNVHYDIAKGRLTKKALQQAEDIIINPEIAELNAEADMDEDVLNEVYNNKYPNR
tara:strand:- start:2862 stop:3236 length:375 start_codon:yes stop_codon:yes gene_type:complete